MALTKKEQRDYELALKKLAMLRAIDEAREQRREWIRQQPIRAAKARKERAKRNKKIKSLLRKGLTHTAIAKIIGVRSEIVSALWRKHFQAEIQYQKAKRAKLKEHAFHMRQNGMMWKDIAKAQGVPLGTANKRYLRFLHDLDRHKNPPLS